MKKRGDKHTLRAHPMEKVPLAPVVPRAVSVGGMA